MLSLRTRANGPILMVMVLEITTLADYQMHSQFALHNGLIPMVMDMAIIRN